MPAEVQMPTPEQAYNTIFSDVHAEVFFQKLASLGFTPRNPQEAQSMLKLAQDLETVEADPAVKAAGVVDPYAEASNALNTILEQRGLNGRLKQATATAHDGYVRQYAKQLMEHPEIFNSVLTLKAAEAAQLAGAMA